MDFKPTLRQALGLAIVRGYDIDTLVKSMTEEEAKEFMIAVHLVKNKLEKSNYPGYKPEDNARRKANNIETGETNLPKTMNRTKQYGGSGPSAAVKQAKKQKQMSAKNPTKIYKDGKLHDVVHSSGRKKGKSIFSSDAERQAHIASQSKKAA